MFYVICPNCDAQVEIPGNAIGLDRDDLFNTAWCDACDTIFDYDDEEVTSDADTDND